MVTMATQNPWYGYKRIAVMCRRAGHAVKNREAYIVMRDHRLLQKPRERAAEVYQAARLFELLPQQPNDLWQMDVTYIHIPGHGWWFTNRMFLSGTSKLTALLVMCGFKVSPERFGRSKRCGERPPPTHFRVESVLFLYGHENRVRSSRRPIPQLHQEWSSSHHPSGPTSKP